MLGDKIKLLRNEARLTQKDLADKLAISKSAIGMYEQNRRLPDIDTLNKIAVFFNVSTDYLIFETNKKRLTDDELKWLKLYSEIPQADRSECFGFVKGYIARGKKTNNT